MAIADVATLPCWLMTAPDAIRRYMDLLHFTNGALDAAILRTSDPMQRVRLMEERRQLATQRAEAEAAFVAHARAWARENDVLREAFLAEGVPPHVLDRAGL